MEELLTNKVAYIGSIRQQFQPYAGQLTQELWAILRDEKTGCVGAMPSDYQTTDGGNKW